MADKENSINKFFHQTLPSWNPNLTIRNSILVFVPSGVLLVLVGTIVLYMFRNMQEISIDYTYCKAKNDSSKTCAEIINLSTLLICECEVPFSLQKDISGTVVIYYGLTNFYQNHRSYVSSKDNKQLMGELKPTVSIDCYPFDYIISSDNKTKIPIAPCGVIANSMFNDRLSIETKNGSIVPLIKKNITWPVMKTNKFKNPPGNLSEAFANFSKPKNWRLNIWELDLEDSSNNGFENEDFIVWMQAATLSNFKKIYRRVNHTGGYSDGLPKGDYVLKVNYSFPVVPFKGSKHLIIANTSVFGTSNYFIAFVYIFTGAICLIVAVAFYILHHKYGE